VPSSFISVAAAAAEDDTSLLRMGLTGTREVAPELLALTDLASENPKHFLQDWEV
jgi:hypothetical protein